MSRLEKLVAKRVAGKKKRLRTGEDRKTRSEAARVRLEARQFRKSFKLMFKKLRRLTSFTFGSYDYAHSHEHAFFEFKGNKLSIGLYSWNIEGHGADDWDIFGVDWSLFVWFGVTHGEPSRIVETSEVKEGVDYSAKVIEILESLTANGK